MKTETPINTKQKIRLCPDCGEPKMTRRTFLQKTGKAAAGVVLAPMIIKSSPVLARGPKEPAELKVKELLTTLSQEQRQTLVLPWADPRRLQAQNNWHVIDQRIAQIYSRSQQDIIRDILRGVTSDEGFDKIMHAMQDDAGGLGGFSAALFSDGADKLCFMLTGRHQTIRADGGSEKNAVFGGPLFYGHAVEFYERPDHTGNVWWHQSRLASKVYHALDTGQQVQALVNAGSPPDAASSVALQGPNGRFSGVPVSDLSADQKTLVEEGLRSLLAPYRESDVEEVMSAIKTNGGLDALHVAFYKDGDLPDKDGIWDRWKIEGPALSWYFRGTPHVHTWVNIAHQAKADS